MVPGRSHRADTSGGIVRTVPILVAAALAVTAASVAIPASAVTTSVTSDVTSWDFGTQYVGHDGIAKTFTLTNTGSAPVTIALGGSAPTWFKLSAPTSCRTELAPAASCAVTVMPHPPTSSENFDQGQAMLQ